MRDEPRYLRAKNTSSEDAPPFAAMNVTGVVDGVVQVGKPVADSSTSRIIFNGPVSIAAGMEGVATRTFPLTAAYDTADGTPGVGDKWGPASGSWKLRSAKKGYMFIGAGSDGFGPVVEAGAAGEPGEPGEDPDCSSICQEQCPCFEMGGGKPCFEPKWARIEIDTTPEGEGGCTNKSIVRPDHSAGRDFFVSITRNEGGVITSACFAAVIQEDCPDVDEETGDPITVTSYTPITVCFTCCGYRVTDFTSFDTCGMCATIRTAFEDPGPNYLIWSGIIPATYQPVAVFEYADGATPYPFTQKFKLKLFAACNNAAPR